MKAQHKAISKETNDNESLANSNALLNPCGYPQKISHSKEKREEVKEAIYLPKVQEGKEETICTRGEQEEKEVIIYIREVLKEKEEIIYIRE